MTSPTPITITPITSPTDLSHCFSAAASAFGTQTSDKIWTSLHPGWNTPAGKLENTTRLQQRFQSTSTNKAGNPNAVYLKATIPKPDGDGEGEIIAGFAIWVQATIVEGYGDAPPNDLKVLNVETLYPGDEARQDYIVAAIKSLTSQRAQVIQEAASRSPPAIMALDLCAVNPAFQRRGIAAKLVQWGLDEAVRRGGLEAVTEASVMGRRVYMKLGFEQEGPEIEYKVDGEGLKGGKLPSNVFLRTGYPPKSRS